MKIYLLLLILCTVFLASCSQTSSDNKMPVSDTEAITDEPSSITVWKSAEFTLCGNTDGYTLYDHTDNPVGTFDEYHTVEAFDEDGSVEELHYLVKDNGDGTYALFALDETELRMELTGVSSIQFWGDFIVTGDHLHTSRLDMIGMFGQIKGAAHEASPSFNEGITFDGMRITYFDALVGFGLPTEGVDYIDSINITADEYTCLFENNGMLLCRVFKPVPDSIYPNGRYMVQYDHPAVHMRDFGEYSHYMGNGVSWIMRGSDLILSGYGEFSDVGGLPIFTQSYHNGASTLFDKNFNILLDCIVEYSVLSDEKILMHRREPTLALPESEKDKSELIVVSHDDTCTLLGAYKYIHAIISEGGFALVSAVSDENTHELMLVDADGALIQTLGIYNPSFTYTDFSGDGGKWVFHFFDRAGEHVTYEYNESGN